MNSKASFGQAAGARSLIERYSLETTTRPRAIAEALDSLIPSGTSIYITAIPGVTTDEVVGAAVRLRRGGLNPVPHVAARSLETPAALQTLLARLTAEAGIDQVLLIGGDIDVPRGPFACALDILRSGVLQRFDIRRIGVAGHPEGHPRIAGAILDAALAAKIEEAQRIGIAIQVVTQFCFSAQPIGDWIARFSERFPEVPIHVGLAGPAAITTLLKYAVACGIGASMRALRSNRGLGRLLTETDPSSIIDELVRSEALASRIAEFHFFPFGGIRRTSQFIRQLPARYQSAGATVD